MGTATLLALHLLSFAGNWAADALARPPIVGKLTAELTSKPVTRPSPRPNWQDRRVTQVELPRQKERFWTYTSDISLVPAEFYQFQMPHDQWAFAANGTSAGSFPASLLLIYRSQSGRPNGQEHEEIPIDEAWVLQNRGDGRMEDLIFEFISLPKERRRKVEWAFELEGKATVVHKDGLLRRARIGELVSKQEIFPSREWLAEERDVAREKVAELEKEAKATGRDRSREELELAKRALASAELLAEHGWKEGLQRERDARGARVRNLEGEIGAGGGDPDKARLLRYEKAVLDLVVKALQEDMTVRLRGKIKGQWQKWPRRNPL